MQTKWAQIQLILEKRLASSGQAKAWLASLLPLWEGEVLVLCSQTEFAAAHIRSWYLEDIMQATEEGMGFACPVSVECRPSVFGARSGPAPAPLCGKIDSAVAFGQSAAKTSQLAPASDALILPGSALPAPRPLPAVQLALPASVEPAKAGHKEPEWRFSFEEFVVGPCNAFAYEAARSMCATAVHSDVLFLSSAPGLGKTHLMQAVGKGLCDMCNRTRPRVEYLTAEAFASAFYLSLKQQNTDSFKAHYRSLDLLLLEDVHFLQGKEKMQAELLETLKALADRGGKVVFTSSFAPRDMKLADEQLQSRFSSGLLTFIERPDEETRRKILRRKALVHQVRLSEEVEDVLVRHIQADIRQLESCLRNLILKARLLNSAITMQMAWEVISQYASHSPVLNMESIIAHVCRGFGLSKEQLVSSSRKHDYVTARNAAFFLARKHTDLSYECIGRYFNRKHSTVIKGITTLEREMERSTPEGSQIGNVLAMIERNGNLFPSI